MIKNHSREIVELRRRRNALLPISHLPNSVLEEIFDCYRELYDAEQLVMLEITQVCHSWRAIASACGRLWTDICAFCPDQVRHYLARSAGCQLSVETHSCDRTEQVLSDESEALRLVLEELPRIRTLVLDTGECFFTKAQLSACRWSSSSVSSSSLQSITLYAPEKTYSGDLDSQFCFTALLLDRDLPSLTHLDITESRFLSSNVIGFPQSLRCLKIEDMDSAAAWNPDMVSVILATLDALPLLESLHLKWAIDKDTPVTVPAVASQVTLSHLQDLTLEIHRQHRVLACLLEHLTFPSTAQASYHVGDCDDIERTFTAVAVKLDGRGLLGHIRPFHAFVIRWDYEKHLLVLVGRVNDCLSMSPEREDWGDVSFVLGTSVENGKFEELIRTSCNMLPLSHVSSLDLDEVCLEFRAETFAAVSQNMPQLGELSIFSWTSAEAPQPVPPFGKASVDVKELFPNLQYIHLHNLSHYKEAIEFWEFLAEVLTSRKGRDPPVKHLCMRYSDDVDPDYRKRLQELVGDLVWEPTPECHHC